MRLSMTCSRFAASRILLLWLDVAIGSCKIHVAAPGSHGSESPPLSVANSHVVCLVGCGHSHRRSGRPEWPWCRIVCATFHQLAMLELMTKEHVFGFRQASRLEQVDDE